MDEQLDLVLELSHVPQLNKLYDKKTGRYIPCTFLNLDVAMDSFGVDLVIHIPMEAISVAHVTANRRTDNG